MPLPKTFGAMAPKARIGLAVAGLAVVIGLFLLLRMAGAPSFTLLATGLDPADSGKVTAALDDQGIGYELQANGTSVAVEKAAVGRARIALATAGVAASGAGGPGFELFDEQKLGASDFQQQVTYQRALEGEIARTINAVDGVSGAQVQLVLPEDDLFADTATPATAAVLLEGAADMLDPGAVRGIAQLTSASVKSLTPGDVTITDGTGRVLWPQGDGSGASEGATAKQAAEARYASQLQADVEALLTRTLGPNKARVQIAADLDMDKVVRDELTYAKKGVPLKTTTEEEKLRGSGSTAGGGAGTAGNIPQYAQGAGGGAGGTSNYQHKTESTDFGVNKSVAKIEQAPGSVKRLSVALMTDKSITDAAAVQAAVAAAVGLDEERGDTITQASVTFPEVEEPKAGPVPVAMLGPAKWGLLGLAVLAFAFLTWRGLRKRESEPIAAPAWLREFDEPMRLAELEGGTRELAVAQRDPGAVQLEQLAAREPQRLAAQVRQWMNED